MERGDPPFHFRIAPVILALASVPERERVAWVRRSGLPESAAAGPCTTSLTKMRRFVDEAALRWPSGDFGLALARAVPEGTYETAELLVRTAPTVTLGLIALARYASLINPVGRFELKERNGRVELHYFIVGHRDGLGEVMNEFTIAYVVRGLRLVGLGDAALDAVWFAHRKVGSKRALEDYFASGVTMGAPTSGFALDAAIAARPLRTTDAVTHGFLERHANERIHALGARTVAAMVAEVIEKEVGLGGLDLAAVAKRLAMTERTAQRRLAEEGTSFREVLDHVRERVAEGMIATGVPSTRIADLLGFSDARSFRRAVARWTREARASQGTTLMKASSVGGGKPWGARD